MTQAMTRSDAGPSDARSVSERWLDVHVPNYAAPSLELTRGSGARVWDTAGKEYLDLLAGIAVNVLGHAHPDIVAAVTRQAGRLAHVSNLYATDTELALARRLQSMTDGRKAIFVNSGTEANEAALKLVRRRAHIEGVKDGVVLAFERSFHGRTLGALSLTGQPAHREGFDPLPGGVVLVPYNEPAALEAAFDAHPVTGVFTEYVQGEGGVRPMNPETAQTLARLTRSTGALLVADEVQTGIARTGRFLAHEHYGHDPDVVTLAKGLGGGYPIGACLVKPVHADSLPAGSHGSTFGGNPVAAAAAHAVLEVVVRERLAERAARLGRVLAERLTSGLGAQCAPRGMGLLLGVPLGAPVAPVAVRRLQEEGLLVGQAGKDVLRLAPPLVVPEEDLLGAVPAIVGAVQAARASA